MIADNFYPMFTLTILTCFVRKKNCLGALHPCLHQGITMDPLVACSSHQTTSCNLFWLCQKPMRPYFSCIIPWWRHNILFTYIFCRHYWWFYFIRNADCSRKLRTKSILFISWKVRKKNGLPCLVQYAISTTIL